MRLREFADTGLEIRICELTPLESNALGPGTLGSALMLKVGSSGNFGTFLPAT